MFRCLILVLAMAPQAADAVEVLQASVIETDNVYRVEFTVLLEAPLDAVRGLVTDYDRFASLSPTVTSSRVLDGAAGGEARIEVTLRPCVLVIFCKTVVKVSDVLTREPDHRVEFTVVPEMSDFHRAREVVTFRRHGSTRHVRFHYTAVLKPRFSVPPLVGPWLVRRQIINDLQITSRRVEKMLSTNHPDD